MPVFDSETEDGRYVVALDETVYGKPLLAVISPSEKVGRIDVHFMPSMYKKDHPKILKGARTVRGGEAEK